MQSLFELIYKGLFLGLITAFSFGPIFFTIIETSISKGHRWAISIAVGVLISDALIISISFLSLGQLIQDQGVNKTVGVIGGFLLIGFGLYQILKAPPPPRTVNLNTSSHLTYLLYVGKGIVVNAVNPLVFIYWLSAVTIVTVDRDYNDADRIIFFAAALLSSFSFDVVKTFFASKLEHLLTPRLINIISKIVGCCIIYFGLRLLWKTLILV